MKITILKANPYPDNHKFDEYLNNLAKLLELSDNSVVHFKLREMKIQHCRGCFGCWVKTPGQCIYKDDSHDIWSDIFLRFAIDFRTSLRFVKQTDIPVQEVSNEINRI